MTWTGPPNSRAIALAILFAAITLGWLLVVRPVTDAFAAQNDDIVQSRELLASLETRIAARPLVEARLAALKLRETTTGGLVAGGNAELAAASVQNTMKALIESEAGQIRSAQNLPPASDGGFEKIDIQYELSLPMNRLREASYRIETGSPSLFLDGVDIRVPENWRGEGVNEALPDMDIRWTVRAYRWTGAQ